MVKGQHVADGGSGGGGLGEGDRGRGGEGKRLGEGGDEFLGGGRIEGAGFGIGGEEGGVAPNGNAVGAALNEESPARERFAGEVFAGDFEDDSAGAGLADEGVGEPAGVGELGGAEGGGLPLGAGGVDGDEGGFTAHGKGDAAALEGGFDGGATGADGFPDRSGEGSVGEGLRGHGWRKVES